MEDDTIAIDIPADIVEIAENTIPEDYELKDWILEWTKFGLEVSRMASTRKEALDIAGNIEKAAVRKFAELVDEETKAFGTRLEALEDLTDVKDQESGFGLLFKDLKDFVDPKNADSTIYKYNRELEKVTEEDGLFRQAVRFELAKERGVSATLQEIRDKLGLDEKEKEFFRRSTLKGSKIEDTLLLNLENLFLSNNLTFSNVGNTTGAIKRSFKGDIILRFGPSHALHRCPIVYEMKSDYSFYLKSSNPDTSATDYLAEAMKNRICKVGIFVMDKTTAKAKHGWKRSLTVAGDKIFVVWDPEDPRTDWLLTAATYIAMGRSKPPENVIDPKQRNAIEKVTKELEAEAKRYGKMRSYIDSITSAADKLSEQIRIGDDGIRRCIKHAKTTLKVLEMDSTELTDINFDDVDVESGGEEE